MATKHPGGRQPLSPCLRTYADGQTTTHFAYGAQAQRSEALLSDGPASDYSKAAHEVFSEHKEKAFFEQVRDHSHRRPGTYGRLVPQLDVKLGGLFRRIHRLAMAVFAVHEFPGSCVAR